MRFRPCIDIHNGKVKQIVGGSLRDEGDQARENFVAGISAADYARLYGKDGLKGGHIILLNPQTSEYYEETKRQAFAALEAAPGCARSEEATSMSRSAAHSICLEVPFLIRRYLNCAKNNYENINYLKNHEKHDFLLKNMEDVL